MHMRRCGQQKLRSAVVTLVGGHWLNLRFIVVTIMSSHEMQSRDIRHDGMVNEWRTYYRVYTVSDRPTAEGADCLQRRFVTT